MRVKELKQSFLNLDPTLEDRLLNNLKETKEGCLIWQGAKNNSGYGSISVTLRDSNKGVSLYVHRVSYALYKGDICNMLVLHRCNTPLCVFEEHLFLGTESDCKLKMYKENPNAKSSRFRSKIKLFDLKTAVPFLLAGESLKERGEKLGISDSHLRHLLKRYNLVGDLRKLKFNMKGI